MNPFDSFDASVRLVRLLAYAVDQMGGELAIPDEVLHGFGPDYMITWAPDDAATAATIRVRRIDESQGSEDDQQPQPERPEEGREESGQSA